MSTQIDNIDHLAGIAAGSPLDALRAGRADIRRHIQGSYDALFAPADPGDLSLIERHAVSLDVARLNEADALIRHHRKRLSALGGEKIADEVEAGKAGAPKLAALLAHARLLTLDPAAATPVAIDALTSAGLSPRGIVALSQLVSFINFQTRLLAGLKLLEVA